MTARIERVRAPNPSAMTLTGTNTYLVAGEDGEAFCIDPGPALQRHVDAIVKRAADMRVRITTIALTHGHPDHAPAAIPLKAVTGARIAAHRQSEFQHDVALRDGERIFAGDAQLRVIETPGHTFEHVTFYEPRNAALFTGDTVLGEGYVVIAPPSGAMRPYQHSLRRLLEEFPGARTIYGGHGEPVADPQAKLRDYLDHRRRRQEEIVGALRAGQHTIPEIVREIYRDTDPVLWPAAARQVLAYLIALEEEGAVTSTELPRDLTREEHAILNPQWESIVGAEHARIVEQELGAMLRLDRVRSYELA